MPGDLVVDLDLLPLLRDEIGMLSQFLSGGGGGAFLGSYWEVAEVIAKHGEELYAGYCKGLPLPSGMAVKHPSGALAHGVRLARTVTDWELHNDAPYASFVEEGTKEWDQKKILQTSQRARRAKDGSLYLIIPFRHGTPGSVGLKAMPQRIYAMAQHLKRSNVTGSRMEPNAHGNPIQRLTYKWGGRLTPKAIEASGGSGADARRFGGMVKFGKAGHSSYMTFRVMSEKSKGWIHPAVAGRWPLKTAIEVSTREGAQHLQDAFLEDLGRLLMNR